MQGHLIDAAAKSLITRWNWDIYHYMRLGTAYLMNIIECRGRDQQALNEASIKDKSVIDYISRDHIHIAMDLHTKLTEYEKIHGHDINIGEMGGNLFLDALNCHESDWKRIKNTLKPIYDHYESRYPSQGSPDLGYKDVRHQALIHGIETEKRLEIVLKLAKGGILVK